MDYETLAVSGVRKRGRPVGADSEQTRRIILCAARDVLAERGYRAATFQQIAVRAGVSRPTLHYYFTTREELYEALLADVRARVDDCVAEAVQADSLFTQLTAFTTAMHRLGTAEPALMKLVVTMRIDHHRAAHRHDAATAVVAAVHAFYDTVVAQAVGRGELARDIDARAVADMLSAVFWGLGFHAGFIAGPDEASGIARQLLRTLEDGLLGQRATAGLDS